MSNAFLFQLQINPHSSDSTAKAKGFLNKMKKPQFVKDAAMVTDIVMRLKKTSLFLQKNHCNIADCQEAVKSTVTSLRMLKQKQVLLIFFE